MSTIPPTGPVADVAAGANVYADWGNSIGASSRGRVVQRFNTAAERDAAIVAPVAGMVCYLASTDTFYGYRAATGWTPLLGGPRDTAHSSINRTATYIFQTSLTNMPYDTITRDTLAMWSIANQYWTVPATGWYQIAAQMYVVTTATNQACSMGVTVGGTLAARGMNPSSVAAGALTASLLVVLYLTANAHVSVQCSCSVASLSSTYTDPFNNRASIDYLGTG